jgi:peptidoglycan/xylan/chitin deacetylase (PgdA/CDA1 family)
LRKRRPAAAYLAASAVAVATALTGAGTAVAASGEVARPIAGPVVAEAVSATAFDAAAFDTNAFDAAATVAAATDEKAERRTDPAEGGTLDIARVAVEQKLHEMTMRVAFTRGAAESLAAAGNGSKVCFTLARGGSERELCAVSTGGGLRATRDGRTISAEAKTSADELVLRASQNKFKLRPGVYRWSVTATAAACDPATAVVPCTDRAPDAGAYEVRVWRVALAGCKAKGQLEVRRGPRKKKVALTFDDGPSSYTDSLLRTLDKHDARATFFMLGSQLRGKGAATRRELAAGHELANHGWSHYPMGGGGPRASSELQRTNRAIRDATGFTPCAFRPPYGNTGPDLRRAVRAEGMTSFIWSVDPHDYASPGPGSIVGNVLANTGPGAIILLHDGGGNRSQTLAAVPQILTSLKRRGYKFVTISELMKYERRFALVR